MIWESNLGSRRLITLLEDGTDVDYHTDVATICVELRGDRIRDYNLIIWAGFSRRLLATAAYCQDHHERYNITQVLHDNPP